MTTGTTMTQVERLQAIIAEKDADIDQLRQALEAAQDEIDDLKGDLQAAVLGDEL